MSPISSQSEGQPVTLTASVTPVVAGTVTFKDGSTNLGTAPLVTSAALRRPGSAALAGGSVGTASLALSNLSVGIHSFGASFTAQSGGATAGALSQVTYSVTALQGVPSASPTPVPLPVIAPSPAGTDSTGSGTSGGGTTSAGSGSRLPMTGAPLLALTVLGLGMVGLGAVMLRKSVLTPPGRHAR